MGFNGRDLGVLPERGSLNEAPNGRTRLVVRTRSHSRPPLLTLPLAVLVGEPVHLIMQTRQFHNLRSRVVHTSQAHALGVTTSA